MSMCKSIWAKISSPKSDTNKSDIEMSVNEINLSDKVNSFLKWCSENGKINKSSMRNLIDKMAVWYELRYPDYEINRLMPYTWQEETKVSEVMFNNNKYVSELLTENPNLTAWNWAEFYNKEAFINSLPLDEKKFLKGAIYRELIFIDERHSSAHLHLTPRGIVEEAEFFGNYTNFEINDDELKGLHIKQVVELLKERNIPLPSNNELEETIKDVERCNYLKEELLNCVMYRIIERGGNRVGPRRGLLFAREFNININVPMMYGIDYLDPGLRNFINEYIEAGGTQDLVCYIGYFLATNETIRTETVTIEEVMENIAKRIPTRAKILPKKIK